MVPKALNPVGNKIPFSVTSTNHILQVGVKAELRLTIGSAGFGVGSNLKLDFFGQIWQFNFVALPDDTDTQISAKLILVDFAMWFSLFIKEIKYNRFIYPFYEVSSSNENTIVFMAREFGEAYSISLGEANPSVIQEVTLPGLNEILRTNFGIHAQVIGLTLADEEIILGEDRISGNEVVFDMHNYLALSVKSDLYFPQTNNAWKKSNTNAVKTFFFRYWERASNYTGKIQTSDQYKAIVGGLTKLHEKLILENAISYTDLMTSGDLLIQSNRPLKSQISYHQPLQFYFVNHYNVTKTFVAHLLIHYTDASSSNVVFSDGNSLSLDPDIQGCFLIGASLHDLKSIHPDKTISSLEFKISAEEESLNSETFVLELKEGLFNRNILFKNSYDTWDSACFLGLNEYKDKYTRLFFEALSTKIQTKVSEKESFIFNSGWLYEQERNWLRELVLSKEIYLVDNNNLFRVNILSTEIIRHIDKDYRYSLQLELELTGDNKYYSAKQANGLAPGIVIADDNFIISDGINTIGY